MGLTALDAIGLAAAAVEAIAKLIAAGADKSTVLEHIRRIEDTAKSLEADVDRIAAGG